MSKRNEIFEQEKKRQIDMIPRVEKIEVHYKGIPEDVTLYLNKDLSTPFNVAQRKQCLYTLRALRHYQKWILVDSNFYKAMYVYFSKLVICLRPTLYFKYQNILKTRKR